MSPVAACMARFGMLHCARVGMGDSAIAFRTRCTALHVAAQYGWVDFAKMLLAWEGIEVNAKTPEGYGWFGYFFTFCVI